MFFLEKLKLNQIALPFSITFYYYYLIIITYYYLLLLPYHYLLATRKLFYLFEKLFFRKVYLVMFYKM